MPAARPPEFRRRAPDLVAQGSLVGQTARDLGISESCLRNWMNRDAVDSGRKAGVTTDEHKELVDLRRRNRVLEMEIEILKRASAYFARGWFLATVATLPRFWRLCWHRLVV